MHAKIGRRKMKDSIKAKIGRHLNVTIKHKGVTENSRIFCDEIIYLHNKGTFQGSLTFDHHLLFWKKRELVFKVWLNNKLSDKEFKNIQQAMGSVGIKVLGE